MNIDSLKETLKSLMNNFDLADYMPQLDTLDGKVELLLRVAVMVGPLVLLGMGLVYFLAAPGEANYHLGYRCYYGMGSVEAWQFTQRLAGIVWSVLGLVLTVVMALIVGGYRDMQMDAMISSAVKCLLWELGLTAVSVLGINVTAMVLFDARGRRRVCEKKNEA